MRLVKPSEKVAESVFNDRISLNMKNQLTRELGYVVMIWYDLAVANRKHFSKYVADIQFKQQMHLPLFIRHSLAIIIFLKPFVLKSFLSNKHFNI